MDCLFGPVPSRRFGYSLGVDVIPRKTCTLDCRYCQLGATTDKTITRRPYVEASCVLAEIDTRLAEKPQIDCITFAGSGEPTLNACLGDIIAGIKSRSALPVTVLTNGTLLYRPDVRSDLLRADIVCPSFDAATAGTFSRINRPHKEITLDLMIQGLKALRREFSGKLHLEIMLVQGINDTAGELEALAKTLPAFGADRIQINTVIRPGAAEGARAVNPALLEHARSLFGRTAEIIADFAQSRHLPEQVDVCGHIERLVARHPATAEEICSVLGLAAAAGREALHMLVARGRLAEAEHGGKTYYQRPD